jgi:hypothetical protein
MNLGGNRVNQALSRTSKDPYTRRRAIPQGANQVDMDYPP